jgi:hypothetical protein
VNHATPTTGEELRTTLLRSKRRTADCDLAAVLVDSAGAVDPVLISAVARSSTASGATASGASEAAAATLRASAGLAKTAGRQDAATTSARTRRRDAVTTTSLLHLSGRAARSRAGRGQLQVTLVGDALLLE